jgi:hypothetical protein
MLSKKQFLKDLKDPGSWLLYLFMLAWGAGLLFVLSLIYLIGAAAFASYGWVHILISLLIYFAFDHHGDVKEQGYWKMFKRFSFTFALMFYIVSFFISMAGIGGIETGAEVVRLTQADFPHGLLEATLKYPFRMALLLFSIFAHIAAILDRIDAK